MGVGRVVSVVLWLGLAPGVAPAAAGGAVSLEQRVPFSKPARTVRTASDAPDRIIVKFGEGTGVRLGPDHFRSSAVDLAPLRRLLAQHGIGRHAVARYFARPEPVLDAARDRAQRRTRRALSDLNLFYDIRLPAGVDVDRLCDLLNALPMVELASPVPLPAPAPIDIPPPTPDFSGRQEYRGQPPSGTGRLDASRLPGADGAGVRMVDVEYNWVLGHEDLGLPAATNIDAATLADPFPDEQASHGTAVLCILRAADNGYGVSGMVPASTPGVAPAQTVESGYNVGRAIDLATGMLQAGDVILVEQQTGACGNPCATSQVGCGPAEYELGTYAAIEHATASGIVVVEGAGNGGLDLDDASCGGRFDRAVRDSGAIVVGAGSRATHARLSFSSYGSRVDLQAWGELVTTCGYGSLFDPGDAGQRYTEAFGGTSAASAIVAAAVASLEGIFRAAGAPLDPRDVRELLVTTGTPPSLPSPEHIGPLPNLVRAIPFGPGARVRATDAVVVRGAPGGAPLGVEAGNGVGTVTEGPAGAPLAGVFQVWWSVVWDDGVVGWSTQALLEDTGSACGNSRLDPGEECDTGPDVSGDCCTAECRLVSAGIVCRAAVRPCDVSEACDGVSATCPPDGVAGEGVGCDDGLFCTDPDRCDAGRCTGAPRSCDDGQACTSDRCDEAAGTCVSTSDDRSCDDGDGCTEDRCDPQVGCARRELPPAELAGVACVIDNLRDRLGEPPAPACEGGCPDRIGKQLDTVSRRIERGVTASTPARCKRALRAAAHAAAALRRLVSRLAARGRLVPPARGLRLLAEARRLQQRAARLPRRGCPLPPGSVGTATGLSGPLEEGPLRGRAAAAAPPAVLGGRGARGEAGAPMATRPPHAADASPPARAGGAPALGAAQDAGGTARRGEQPHPAAAAVSGRTPTGRSSAA